MAGLDWRNVKQLSPLGIILAFLLPSAFAFTGFRVDLPALVRSDIPVMIGWPVVATVMLSVLVLLALILHRSESKQLSVSWASRRCFKKLSWKQWLLYCRPFCGQFPQFHGEYHHARRRVGRKEKEDVERT